MEAKNIYDGYSVYPIFRVKYHGPTDTRGSYIRATIKRDGQRLTASEPYDHAISGFSGFQEQAVRVALELRGKQFPDALPVREAIVGDADDGYDVIFTV